MPFCDMPTHDGFRIGIMLRGIDEVDGAGVYIRGLCSALFDSDSRNEYVLYYRNRQQSGRYSNHHNVAERVVYAPSKLLWDQVAVPWAARQDDLDVLFHHKFSVPILSPCPTVVQQRGAEYWLFPQWYDLIERMYAYAAIPIFCRVASRVLTNSRSLAEQLSRFIHLEPGEMDHIYAAPDEQFQPVTSPDRLDEVRRTYSLPENRFFLMVAKGYSNIDRDNEEFYPRKNVQGVVQAYSNLQSVEGAGQTPPLVVAGPGFGEDEIEALTDGLPAPESVCFPSYVEFDDMPAIYSMALALVFPSYSESFGIPLIEAMACGCPVISSNTSACPEVVGEAGLLVDPYSVEDIQRALKRVMQDEELQERLARDGLSRAGQFTWEPSAEKLRAILEETATGTSGGAEGTRS